VSSGFVDTNTMVVLSAAIVETSIITFSSIILDLASYCTLHFFKQMSRTCSTTIRLRKANAMIDMYATLDLGQRTVRAVLKRQDGKIVNELKIKKQADTVLRFLTGTSAMLMW